MLKTLAISNYRSLRNLVIPLSALNLITGPNGSVNVPAEPIFALGPQFQAPVMHQFL